MRNSGVTIWRLFLRPIGSKRQSRALNSMFCYKLPERAPDSEPPPVSWLVVGCKDRHNISHIQMFCEQIYSLITPSLRSRTESNPAFAVSDTPLGTLLDTPSDTPVLFDLGEGTGSISSTSSTSSLFSSPGLRKPHAVECHRSFSLPFPI